MAQYLFIHGRPGSGKSTLARAITQRYGGESNVETKNDYSILWDMFVEEQQNIAVSWPQFRRREQHGSVGFDILDRQVLRVALCALNEEACRYRREPKLVLLEFSRNNYTDIWTYFSQDILKHAHFLFVRTPLETCIQRIQQRVKHQCYPGDRLVSEETMRANYGGDGLAGLRSACEPGHLSVINNEGSWSDAWAETQGCLDEMLYRVAMPSVWSIADLKWARPSLEKPRRNLLLI